MLIKSTESLLIENKENRQNRISINSKLDREAVSKLRSDQCQSLAFGEEFKIENILRHQGGGKRHSLAVGNIIKTSRKKSNDLIITVGNFINSNVDIQSNQAKLAVNIVRRKNI